MTEDRFTELASLVALEALDGEDLEAYRVHEASCSSCRAEREREALLVAALGPLSRAHPDPALRARLLAAVGRGRRPRTFLTPLLAAACLGLAFATGWLLLDLERSRSAERAVEVRIRLAESEVATLRESAGFQTLVFQPGSRMTHLAAEEIARGSDACIVWNPHSGEAVLVAAGLAPPPEGKAYELWVISGGLPPIPAGVFRVDEGGKVVFRMPPLREVSGVKAFAVTLEPEGGTPSPTGPRVLTGLVS